MNTGRQNAHGASAKQLHGHTTRYANVYVQNHLNSKRSQDRVRRSLTWQLGPRAHLIGLGLSIVLGAPSSKREDGVIFRAYKFQELYVRICNGGHIVTIGGL